MKSKETQSSCNNWYLSEFVTLYYMPKGPKNGFKKPKNEEIIQISWNFKKQALQTGYWGKKQVRYEFHPSAKRNRGVINEKCKTAICKWDLSSICQKMAYWG